MIVVLLVVGVVGVSANGVESYVEPCLSVFVRGHLGCMAIKRHR